MLRFSIQFLIDLVVLNEGANWSLLITHEVAYFTIYDLHDIVVFLQFQLDFVNIKFLEVGIHMTGH